MKKTHFARQFFCIFIHSGACSQAIEKLLTSHVQLEILQTDPSDLGQQTWLLLMI